MSTEKEWTEAIKKKLVGKTIIDVVYLPEDKAKEFDWSCRPIVLCLDDGDFVFPMMDDEGNDGGALATTYEDLDTIGVMR